MGHTHTQRLSGVEGFWDTLHVTLPQPNRHTPGPHPACPCPCPCSFPALHNHAQGFDDFEIIDFEKKPPTGKSRFMSTPPPKPSEAAGPVSRASLAARAAAAAAAAAGIAVRSTRDRVTWLLHKVGRVWEGGSRAAE